MPKVGELLKLKITKITKNGAFLSNPAETSHNYFLHIKEASDKKWLDSMEEVVTEGEMVSARVIEVKKFQNKITYQVSLKDTDETAYKEKQFKDKIEGFMKRSGEVQSQIKKNQNRKFDGRKPKNKKSL